MDEQRLRARLAALEMAQMATGWVTDGYTDLLLGVANDFENWLMRPAPVDVEAAHAAAERNSVHCPTTWKRDNGAGHACGWLPAHLDSVGHLCSCGDRLEVPSP